jgi:hypothetical protein
LKPRFLGCLGHHSRELTEEWYGGVRVNRLRSLLAGRRLSLVVVALVAHLPPACYLLQRTTLHREAQKDLRDPKYLAAPEHVAELEMTLVAPVIRTVTAAS